MTLISIVNNKGGSSKTTTAIHLARFIINQGYSLAFIDCDNQMSSSEWLKSMNLGAKIVATNDVDDFEDMAIDLSEEFDCVVVDTPANAEDIQRVAIGLSDFVLVPTQPTHLDLAGCSSTIKKIKVARKRASNLEAYIFLTRVINNSNIKKASLDYISELEGITALDIAIPQTVRIAELSNSQKTAYDLPKKDLAKLYDQLFEVVLS